MEDKRRIGNGWSRESSVSITGSPASYFSPFDKLDRKIEKKVSNQSMKPTAPLRNKLTHSLPLTRPSARPSMSLYFPQAPFSVLATTPCRGLSPSR